MRTLSTVFCLLLTTASCASAQEPAASTVYRDVTATHVPSAPDLHALDAVLVDVDGDRDLDVAVAVEGGANRLYLNDGQGRLSWREGAFGSAAHDSEHVLSADFDRDGFPDLIFVAEDDMAHSYYRGGPEGRFTDATDRLPARSEGNGLAVGDVNGDGLPDVVVGNSGGRGRSGQNFLWLGDASRPGWFVDATASSLPARSDDTQGIALADLDGDGDLDMVVANETPPNRLLLNDGRGRFADHPDRLDLPVPLETRQAHVFDATGDGHPDILLLNLTSNNRGRDKDPRMRLLVNDGGGRFRDESEGRLPATTFSTWGGTPVDFDHDGDLDLVVGPIEVPGFTPQRVRAYANDGTGRFADVTDRVIPAGTAGRSWGMAVGDLDGDGTDDLFIGGWGTQARLLLGSRAPAALEPGFTPIFDGRTLQGWEGDPLYWRVENGAIVGEVTPQTLLQRNTFLVWRGGTVDDFELRVEYRITNPGNSGISYRNAEVPGVPHALTGYQADLDGPKRYVGSNYEERGRTTLAAQGQRVRIPPMPAADSLRALVRANAWTPAVVEAQLGSPDSLDARVRDGDWNEYHIVARGNRLQHFVNGVLMSDVTDEDVRNRRSSGLLGVQVHVGPPMKVEYRNFRLKPLR